MMTHEALTRRRALAVGGTAIAATVWGVAASANAQAAAGPGFGFLIPAAGARENWKVFDDLQIMKSMGCTWVRIPLPAGSIVSDWFASPTAIATNSRVVSDIKTCLKYAKSLGFKICLLTVNSLDVEDEQVYNARTDQYWKFCADNFARYADQWQLYNEQSGYHYRLYKVIPPDQLHDYQVKFRDRLVIGRDLIHRANPKTQVTTNLFGYPVTDATESDWRRALDVIAPAIDLITVDCYPDMWTEDIEAIPGRLAGLSRDYGKPICIGEIGLPSADFSESDQAATYGKYIDVLKSSCATAVHFYELLDMDERKFGVIRWDNTDKPARAVVTGRLTGR